MSKINLFLVFIDEKNSKILIIVCFIWLYKVNHNLRLKDDKFKAILENLVVLMNKNILTQKNQPIFH